MPNKKKECTILLKKSQEHEQRFVKLAAKEINQPLLDCYISGRDPEGLFNTDKTMKSKQKCQVCDKTFTSQKYLKIHISKIHTATKNKCDYCDFSDNDKIKVRSHMKNEHEINVPTDQSMNMDHDTNITDPAMNMDHDTNCTDPAMNMDDDTDCNDKQNELLANLEKVSFEEKRIEYVLMDTLDGNETKT